MPPSDDESTTRIVCCDEGCYRHAHAVNHKVRRKGRQAREEEKTALSLSLSLWVAARKMAVLQLWETLKLAITAYTGLSPATFFTILAVAFALYHALSGMFSFPAPPPRRTVEEKEDREPLPPPVQLGEITEEELRAYDGSDPKKPLLMAIKGQIYDVSQSRMFYGPGGPYALFAGRDASRALAKMSFEEKDLTGDIEGLGPFELDALQDWQYRFMGKYAKVGTIKKNTAPVTESDAGLATNSSAGSEIAETVENPSENLKLKDGASTTDEAQG